MAIEMKGLPRIDFIELPSQVFTRFENEKSDGGASITLGERHQLKQLYHHYTQNNFASLQTLRYNTVFNELKALKQIEELPEPFMFSDQVMGLGMTARPLAGIQYFLMLLIPAGMIVLGLGAWLFLENIAETREEKIKDRIDSLEAALKVLDERKANGEMSPENYEKSRRILIESTIRSNR